MHHVRTQDLVHRDGPVGVLLDAVDADVTELAPVLYQIINCLLLYLQLSVVLGECLTDRRGQILADRVPAHVSLVGLDVLENLESDALLDEGIHLLKD